MLNQTSGIEDLGELLVARIVEVSAIECQAFIAGFEQLECGSENVDIRGTRFLGHI